MLSKNYVSAVAILISSIVGVGMFTLPFIASKAGLLTIIFYFIVLGFIQHWFHKVYALIVLSTKKQHRLPGYAEKYLGKNRFELYKEGKITLSDLVNQKGRVLTIAELKKLS